MGQAILDAAVAKKGTGSKMNVDPKKVKQPDGQYEYRLGGKGGEKSDTDSDGFMEIDCSGLVSDALKDAGYTMGSFGTHDLFNGEDLTPFSKKHFDVISKGRKDLGNLQNGDLILMKQNTGGGQHIVIFAGYTEKKPYIPHAIVFFIGGAGDQEPFVTIGKQSLLPKSINGANHNVDYAKKYFDKEKLKLISNEISTRIYTKSISYTEIYNEKEISHLINSHIKIIDELDKKHDKRTIIYIIGHSLGGWNGAHLTEQLSNNGYTTEMLITLDPVGTHHYSSLLGADIYCSEPNVKATKWINIRCEGGSYNFPDFVADLGGQWISANATPTIQATTSIHHENADGLFTIKIGTSGKSALDNLIESIQGKLK